MTSQSESMAASVEVGLKFIAFVPCNALYDNTNFYTNMCPMHAGHMMFIFDLQIDARAGNLGTRRENGWFKSVRIMCNKITCSLIQNITYLFINILLLCLLMLNIKLEESFVWLFCLWSFNFFSLCIFTVSFADWLI